MQKLNLTGWVMLALSATAVNAATVNLHDGTFENWVSEPLSLYGSLIAQPAERILFGGNPDYYLQVSPEVTYTRHANPLLTYDPALGPIESLTWSIDWKTSTPQGQGMVFFLLARQNGVDFTSNDGYIAEDSNANWNTYISNALYPWQFSSSPGTLDFSSNGSPITFGLGTVAFASAGNGVGFDNFRVSLNIPTASVPEGGASALLASLGMLALGLVRRGR